MVVNTHFRKTTCYYILDFNFLNLGCVIEVNPHFCKTTLYNILDFNL